MLGRNGFTWGIILALGVLLGARTLAASQLQLPHTGGRDGELSGNVVASPSDGSSSLLFNPAGVTVRQGTEVSTTFMMVNLTARYLNAATGYDHKSSETPIVPTFWVQTDRAADWHVGAGLYGSVGSAFNFPADPKSGMPGQLLGDFQSMHLGLVAGREVLPGLRLGLQVAPSYGKMKSRIPTPLGNVEFDIAGFGIVGAAGLLYDVTDRATVGLAYRPLGILFLDGDGKVAGRPEKVSLDFRLPPNLVFGFAYRLTDQLLISTQANWVDYRVFEDSKFELSGTPLLNNSPYVSDARATFRYGIGLEYTVPDWGWLRCGLSREDWAIEPGAVRPVLYDTADTMGMVGAGVLLGRWTLEFQTGYAVMEDRVVTTGHQVFFPGRYEMESNVGFGIGITRRLGS